MLKFHREILQVVLCGNRNSVSGWLNADVQRDRLEHHQNNAHIAVANLLHQPRQFLGMEKSRHRLRQVGISGGISGDQSPDLRQNLWQ